MHRCRSLAASAVLALVASLAAAPSKPPAAGHWEGSIQIPNHELKIAVDLDLDEKGAWIGDLDIPEQGLNDFPLSRISFKENIVKFELVGMPGDPAFEGEISPDGTILAGDLSQGGDSTPVELKRISEAKVVLPAKNTRVAKEFEGSWDCPIPAQDGKNHPAVLKLATGADGLATGVLMGSEGVQFPVSGIVQTGAGLKFEIKPIGAVFSGERRGDEIPGVLELAGKEMPLKLKRVTEAGK